MILSLLFHPKHSFMKKRYFHVISSLQHTKIINFDDITNENQTKHNIDWPYIPDYLHRIIIINSSESGNAMHYKIYYIIKQVLIRFVCQRSIWIKVPAINSKVWGCRNKTLQWYKGFMKYLNTMGKNCNNITNHNPNRNWKILIASDEITADTNTNKKFQSIAIKPLDAGNCVYLLYSLNNLIFLFQKKSDWSLGIT